MCRALAGDALDLPFAAVYLSAPDGPGFRRVATVGCDRGPAPGGPPTDASAFDGVAGTARRAPAVRSVTLSPMPSSCR